MTQNRSLTRGEIAPQLMKLALPLLVGNILQQLYNTADAVIIGRWVGADAFAAVGIAGTVMNLFLFLLCGGCAGVAVLFSQLYGEGDMARFRQEFFLSAAFGGLFTLGLSGAALLLLEPVLGLIQTPEVLRGYTADYLRVIFGGFLAAYAYNLCAGALRAVGDTLAAMCVLGAAILANVGLDLLLVARLSWGIAGAAWATVAAQSLAAGLALVYVRLRRPELLFGRGDMRYDHRLLCSTARFGAVTALHQSSLYIGKLLVQGAVNTMGTDAISAYTASVRIEGFANSFGDSGAEAVSVFTGQNVGAGKRERVRSGFWSGMKLLVALGVTMSLIMGVGAEIFSALMLPRGTGDELSCSVAYLRVISIFYVLCFIGNCYVGFFRGSGRVDVPVMGTVLHISIRVVLSWLLARRMGLTAVALATGLGWMAVVGFQTLVFRGRLLVKDHV